MLTEILYEDRDVLVARKPAGLAVQTARVGQQDMVSELKNYLSLRKGHGASPARQEPYLGIIHRLDQPVEGLLVFAKSRQAAASLTRQLQDQGEEGTFCKHYYAVLFGIPAQREGELSDYLRKEAVRNGKQKEYKAIIVDAVSERQDSFSANRAALRYRILQVQEAQNLALADICIETGRFHQIRAQMAHAGMPLLGDVKYGGEEAKAASQASGIRNVALCAYHLQFVHPVSRKKMDFRIKPQNPAFSFFSQL